MNRKIVIYGTGDYGKRLFDFWKEMNVKIDFFCQTKVEENKRYLYGIPVISPYELGQKDDLKSIFIAINDTKISGMVKRQLQNILPCDDEIFECGDFIRKNLSTEKNQKCNICGSEVGAFISGGEDNAIFEAHYIIGGGRRGNCICPSCGSFDRERWCLDVIKHCTHIFDSSCRVLHFAPERGLAERIRANELADYYCGDISKYEGVNKVDVTNMSQFGDAVFDYIIINHVLEHVMNLEIALAELRRVLKKDGKIIMSFPICTDMETIEQTKKMTDEERVLYFGQKDHVRLFGRDYKERIESYGFQVSVISPKHRYSHEQIEYYGFIEDDVILICEK